MTVALEHRRVRDTGLCLPSVGLGSAGIGGLYASVSDAEAHDCLTHLRSNIPEHLWKELEG